MTALLQDLATGILILGAFYLMVELLLAFLGSTPPKHKKHHLTVVQDAQAA